MGFTTISDTIQFKSMNERLHNDIYNFCSNLLRKLKSKSQFSWEFENELQNNVWQNLYHKSLNHSPDSFNEILESLLSEKDFYKTYDLLEFILQNYGDSDSDITTINSILRKDRSGYRFIKNKLVPISSNIDLKNLKHGINSGIDNGHLEMALKELSEPSKQNYTIVMKEAIDAVEFATHQISVSLFNGKPKDSMKQSISILEKNGFIDNHSAYLTALSKLYGYSSDSGIRHPKDRPYKFDQADATFMLEICSAFISMLKFKLAEYQNNNK
ncbi:hypothetical protein [Lactobacillus curvatus] [Lactiplantibacillus mudanjiangensis]|nr:hypothetical protein [Lactobacillus curvatus] [Lactiplantibacillus mudanjiangensis]